MILLKRIGSTRARNKRQFMTKSKTKGFVTFVRRVNALNAEVRPGPVTPVVTAASIP
jgi:hypothetical protein